MGKKGELFLKNLWYYICVKSCQTPLFLLFDRAPQVGAFLLNKINKQLETIRLIVYNMVRKEVDMGKKKGRRRRPIKKSDTLDTIYKITAIAGIIFEIVWRITH